uniref:Kaptin n=1 Tax=Syphacia muris TaxID=451379 RepID=A0A0N5APS6_9BILA
MLACDSHKKIKIYVLSSPGHVYVELLDKGSALYSDGAYFMTNTLQLPVVKAAVSMHYSLTYHLLFVSLQDAVYVLNVNDDGTSSTVHKIPMEIMVDGWSECAGVISAICLPDKRNVVFMYFDGEIFHIQQVSVLSPINAICVLLSLDYVSHIAIGINEEHKVLLYRRNYQNIPDFWISGLECDVRECNKRANTGKVKNLCSSQADMVTIFDSCTLLEKIEYHSEKLLRRYDSAELGKRFNSKTMSVVSVHDNEFDIVVRNLDWNYVICALSIEVSNEEGPEYVTAFGRKISLATERRRTFDIILNRADSLNCNVDKGKTLLDSKILIAFVAFNATLIQVYGKTKKDFGFPNITYEIEQKLTAPEALITSFLNFYCDAIEGFGLKQV